MPSRTLVEHGDVFFCSMPSKQGPVQGRFKPAHCPIIPGTRVKGSVRRFETPIALSDGRAWQKKTSPCSAEKYSQRINVLLPVFQIQQNLGYFTLSISNIVPISVVGALHA